LHITHILARRPATFSGGEQQRTAIGRAIAKPSRLLMLDEPLSNLDAGLRTDLRREFRRLHRKLGQSILYVTHDQAEALSLADRIVVLDRGRIVQQGTADDLYDRPETAFVAEFIGTPPFNFLPATVDRAMARLVGEGFDLALPAATNIMELPGQVQLAVRPEAFHVSQTRQSRTPIAASLRWIERHGPRDLLGLEIGSATVKVSTPVGLATAPGQALWLGFDLMPDHILDPVSQRFLRVSSEGTKEYVQDL
jgi:multiple sugar transport system ATP-binding protein